MGRCNTLRKRMDQVGVALGMGSRGPGPGSPVQGLERAGFGMRRRWLPPGRSAGGRGAKPNSGRHDVTRVPQPMRTALAWILRKVSACLSTLFSYH